MKLTTKPSVQLKRTHLTKRGKQTRLRQGRRWETRSRKRRRQTSNSNSNVHKRSLEYGGRRRWRSRRRRFPPTKKRHRGTRRGRNGELPRIVGSRCNYDFDRQKPLRRTSESPLYMNIYRSVCVRIGCPDNRGPSDDCNRAPYG